MTAEESRESILVKITAWVDDSSQGERLLNDLTQAGYNVNAIATGAITPIVERNGYYYSGYRRIHEKFIW